MFPAACRAARHRAATRGAASGGAKLYNNCDLPFSLGEFSVAYGMVGTPVVAGQAVRAAAVPPGQCRFAVEADVVQRAELGAAAAAGTEGRVGREMAVGGEETVEEGAEHVTLEAGPRAGHHIGRRGGLAAGYAAGHAPQGVVGPAHLVAFSCGGVGVEARQADVGVAHLHGVDGVERVAALAQGAAQQAVGAAYVVAAGQHGVNVGRDLPTRTGQTADETAHHAGQPPAVNGEDEAQHTFGLQAAVSRRAGNGVGGGDGGGVERGHVGHAVVKLLRQQPGGMERIAGSGEATDHFRSFLWNTKASANTLVASGTGRSKMPNIVLPLPLMEA